jgi:hypothetical protein
MPIAGVPALPRGIGVMDHVKRDVSDGSKAPFCPSADDFRSTPINGHHQTGPGCAQRQVAIPTYGLIPS